MKDRLKEIEIPFGAKDSELCGWEYTIPEGMEATIVDNKIVVKKKESEDERIRKELIEQVVYIVPNDDEVDSEGNVLPTYQKRIDKYLAWLEKQGEHANFLSKIQVGDKVTRNEDGVLVNLSHLKRVAKPSEQKPADKVEPKFHEGDWVVYCNDDVDLITGIEENGYCINNGGYIPFICEKEMRLWDITDAKVGDVLVSESTCGLGTWYCIFKSLDGDESMTVYCYLTRDGRFETKKELCFDKDPYNTNPATKEQREQLEKAMADAGYEWDAELKQLRKIEPKKEPTEFECGYKQAIEDAVRYMDKVWGLNILGNCIDDFRETMEQKLKELSQG